MNDSAPARPENATPHSPPQTPLDLLALLFPGAAPRVSGRGLSRATPGHRRLLAMPHLTDVRLFLPDDAPGASGAFRRARHPVGARGRAITALGTIALRGGVGRLLPSHVEVTAAGSIEEELSRRFDRQVEVAVFLGPQRANRKPVLQVISDHGELLAVAKMGVNPITDALAAREANALRRLAGISTTVITTPDLVADFAWGPHQLVVQSVLPIPQRPAPPEPASLRAAIGEIARVGGLRRHELAGSRYLQRLREQVRTVPHSELRAVAAMALGEVAASRISLDFGAWHGDFSPWNVAAHDGTVLVWDWERFDDDVPLGFDALHHHFMPLLKREDLPEEVAGTRLIEDAAKVLTPQRVDADVSRQVALLYLIEIGSRFAGDGQHHTASRGGEVERWLLPTLRRFEEKG